MDSGKENRWRENVGFVQEQQTDRETDSVGRSAEELTDGWKKRQEEGRKRKQKERRRAGRKKRYKRGEKGA